MCRACLYDSNSHKASRVVMLLITGLFMKVDVYDGRESGGNISVLLDVTAEGQQV